MHMISLLFFLDWLLINVNLDRQSDDLISNKTYPSLYHDMITAYLYTYNYVQYTYI